MGNRTLALFDEAKIQKEWGEHPGYHSILRIERSAAGQPRLLFIIESFDDDGEVYSSSMVIVPNGRKLLAPVMEWLKAEK